MAATIPLLTPTAPQQAFIIEFLTTLPGSASFVEPPVMEIALMNLVYSSGPIVAADGTCSGVALRSRLFTEAQIQGTVAHMFNSGARF